MPIQPVPAGQTWPKPQPPSQQAQSNTDVRPQSASNRSLPASRRDVQRNPHGVTSICSPVTHRSSATAITSHVDAITTTSTTSKVPCPCCNILNRDFFCSSCLTDRFRAHSQDFQRLNTQKVHASYRCKRLLDGYLVKEPPSGATILVNGPKRPSLNAANVDKLQPMHYAGALTAQNVLIPVPSSIPLRHREQVSRYDSVSRSIDTLEAAISDLRRRSDQLKREIIIKRAKVNKRNENLSLAEGWFKFSLASKVEAMLEDENINADLVGDDLAKTRHSLARSIQAIYTLEGTTSDSASIRRSNTPSKYDRSLNKSLGKIYTILGLALPLPRDIPYYPREEVNAAIVFTVDLLTILINYLGFELPFVIDKGQRPIIKPRVCSPWARQGRKQLLWVSSSSITSPASSVAPTKSPSRRAIATPDLESHTSPSERGQSTVLRSSPDQKSTTSASTTNTGVYAYAALGIPSSLKSLATQGVHYGLQYTGLTSTNRIDRQDGFGKNRETSSATSIKPSSNHTSKAPLLVLGHEGIGMALAMLAYNIAFICHSQGLRQTIPIASDPLKNLCNLLSFSNLDLGSKSQMSVTRGHTFSDQFSFQIDFAEFCLYLETSTQFEIVEPEEPKTREIYQSRSKPSTTPVFSSQSKADMGLSSKERRQSSSTHQRPSITSLAGGVTLNGIVVLPSDDSDIEDGSLLESQILPPSVSLPASNQSKPRHPDALDKSAHVRRQRPSGLKEESEEENWNLV